MEYDDRQFTDLETIAVNAARDIDSANSSGEAWLSLLILIAGAIWLLWCGIL